MPIAQLGQVNVSALSVPQALVQIVPPQYLFGGVPSNVGGFVGTASWGPVNIPMSFGSYGQYAATFGPTINRKYDMGAHVILAAAQGAGYFYGVRVTDGTDVAALIAVQTNCITFTARYTGTLGNSIKVTVGAGTQNGTQKVVVACNGLTPEVFDNIGSGLTGAALWAAIASAINNGLSATRGPSSIIIATAGVGVTTPSAATVSLSGGTDGVTTITSAVMLGLDTVPRKGMYALRGTPISRFDLCDVDDTTSFSAQVVFALDAGAEAICVTPAGDTLTSAATELNTAGIDSYACTVIFGDWVYWIDTVNNIPMRLTSPQAVKMGIRGNLSPQNSALNKPIYGIVGTQASVLGKQYSYSDFQALAAARLDVLTNQSPGGNYFAFRLGINTSSNAVIVDDAYTDVTNWLAKSILVIAGQYIGQTQSPDERRRARVSLIEFLDFAQNNGIIGTADDSQAYQVILDNTNNNQASVALGFQFAYVKAVYLGIVRYFVINLEGGASVTVSNTPPLQ